MVAIQRSSEARTTVDLAICTDHVSTKEAERHQWHAAQGITMLGRDAIGVIESSLWHLTSATCRVTPPCSLWHSQRRVKGAIGKVITTGSMAGILSMFTHFR